MARTIEPGNPTAINPVNVKIPEIDLEIFDKYGDAKIKSAMQNFNLYANATINNETQKLYQQYKNNPIALGNALSKMPETLTDLPESMQADMKEKLDKIAIPMVMKAQINQQNAIDAQNKALGIANVDTSKAIMSEMYQGVLQNHIANAEDKQENYNKFFVSQMGTLDSVSNMVDSNGIPVYSDSQRKAMRNIDNLELAGFKRFFDTMLINDNNDLEKTKDYYQKYLLAPERFMAENYMNRETYDKARAYAEKELRRAGADIQKAKFNQSVKEYAATQIEDLPGRLTALKESGLFPKQMIDNLEKVNLKFNEIDPSKPESPVALINTLQLLKELSFKKPTTEAEQQQILETGTRALDMIADFGKEYGLSEKTMDIARKNVVLLETDAAWAPVLDNFNAIIDNFDRNLARTRVAQTKSSGAGKWYALTRWDGMSNEESRKYMELNNLLANSMVQMHNALRVGDNETLRKIQRETQVEAAKMLYDWVDWDEVAKNKNYVCPKNGLFVCPVNINKNGSVDFKIVK